MMKDKEMDQSAEKGWLRIQKKKVIGFKTSGEEDDNGNIREYIGENKVSNNHTGK